MTSPVLRAQTSHRAVAAVAAAVAAADAVAAAPLREP